MKKLFTILIIMSLLANFATIAASGASGSELIKDYESGKYGDEMYCLTSISLMPPDDDEDVSDPTIVIYIKDKTATIIYYQSGRRYKKRKLSAEELTAFTAFIKENKIDTLKSYDSYSVADGAAYQYLHASKDKRASFSMNNPGVVGGRVYEKLVGEFYKLANTGTFKTAYMTDKNIKFLINTDDFKEYFYVEGVWQQGDDMRVLATVDTPNGYRSAWYQFSDNKLQGKTTEPPGINIINAFKDVPTSKMFTDAEGVYRFSGLDFWTNYINYPWQTQWGEYSVCSLQDYDAWERDDYSKADGLWLTQKGKEPKLIRYGKYNYPVVIPNTDWVVCEKNDKNWTYKLVKIDLKTAKEYVLDVGPTEYDLRPIAYLGGKLIVRNNKKNYLLNISTGNKTSMPADCPSLTEIKERPLQKAPGQNEYYAAKYTSGTTIVGKLNTATFKFSKIAEYKGLNFNSMRMWVDEAGKKVYAVINGDLLELAID